MISNNEIMITVSFNMALNLGIFSEAIAFASTKSNSCKIKIEPKNQKCQNFIERQNKYPKSWSHFEIIFIYFTIASFVTYIQIERLIQSTFFEWLRVTRFSLINVKNCSETVQCKCESVANPSWFHTCLYKTNQFK